MIWLTKKHVVHPDWVKDAEKSLHGTMALYADGALPESIEVPMIVIPVKRLLRGVYGSERGYLWALLCQWVESLPGEAWSRLCRFWKFTILRRDPDVESAKLEAELEAEIAAATAKEAEAAK